MMESSISVCPVPTEQQPLNEYEQLKTSLFFRTATLELPKYSAKMCWIWGLSWIVAGPVAFSSFAPSKHLAQFIVSGAVGASLGVMLVVVRLYLGWSYVQDRLSSSTIFYEETGWYDGQNWTKPSEVVTRDRLIVNYQVKPLLQRLQKTLGLLALLLLSGGVIWNYL